MICVLMFVMVVCGFMVVVVNDLISQHCRLFNI